VAEAEVRLALEAARRREVATREAGWGSVAHGEADAEVERLERQLARERGDELAVPLNVGIEWNPNADDACLVHSWDHAYLALNPHFSDPDRDRVVFRWAGCRGAVLSGPNDEARSGHRLWRSGLRGCLWAAEVFNSHWIGGLERANRVHPRHRPESYQGLRHFILLLKETTFECVADGFEVSRRAGLSDLAGLT
jgi:hypothetical protein